MVSGALYCIAFEQINKMSLCIHINQLYNYFPSHNLLARGNLVQKCKSLKMEENSISVTKFLTMDNFNHKRQYR